MGDEVGMGVDVESEWGKVVERYRSNPEAHTRKISGYKSGTALHGALEKNEHQVAQHLLKAMLLVSSSLEMEDESGDTALHVAASKGFVGVCRLIIGGKEERKSLVKKRNKKGETPLFLAALSWNRKKHVNKYTVAYLIDVLGDEYTIFDLVRDDGDTILHSAIRYQYFDLAVILLHRYDSLLDIGVRANGRGITPLKALAAVPSAFRSANEISGWKLVLYHCIVAEPVDPDTAMRSYLEKAANDKFLNFVRKQKTVFPDNYPIVRLLYDSMRRGVRRIIYWLCNDCSGVEKASKDTESVDTEGNYDHGGFPPNYFTLKQFINFVIRCFAVFYGLGAWGYDEVRMKKMKHKYSHQLLKLLMKNPNLASGDGLGRKPTGDFNDVLGQSYTDYFDEVHGLQQSNNQGESSGKKVGWAEEEEIEESAFVTAVRNGIVEMVNEILKVMPNAMYDKSKKGENVFWVAVKKRQPFVIEELKRRSNADRILEDFINGAVDGEDNILHLAAHSIAEDQPAQIAGVALQMMWDTSCTSRNKCPNTTNIY